MKSYRVERRFGWKWSGLNRAHRATTRERKSMQHLCGTTSFSHRRTRLCKKDIHTTFSRVFPNTRRWRQQREVSADLWGLETGAVWGRCGFKSAPAVPCPETLGHQRLCCRTPSDPSPADISDTFQHFKCSSIDLPSAQLSTLRGTAPDETKSSSNVEPFRFTAYWLSKSRLLCFTSFPRGPKNTSLT